VLAGFARGSKKRVVALETTETQQRALTRGGTVASLGKAMDEIESGRAVAKLRLLANMWADANAGELSAKVKRRWTPIPTASGL
jgi:uncharacterized protein YbaP (TraB family)